MCVSCGKKTDTSPEINEGEEAHVCRFVEKVAKPKYIKTRASCTQRSEFYYSCSCGAMGTESFAYGEMSGHDYYIKKAEQIYLVKEATVKTSAVYYKSCTCGAVGVDTFEYGKPIELDEATRPYLPASLTVTLYDTELYTYGFTYNTYASPREPVIQIKRPTDSEWTEYIPTSYETSTLDPDDNTVPLYISKAEITLLPNTEYVYRVGDKGLQLYTPEASLKTKSSSTDSFTFAHLSDSQAGPDEFGRVMAAVSGSSDFVVHTGDVVQYARYEYEWFEMLDGNYEQLMGMPIMAITGNHETSYSGATYGIANHFNNAMPEQSSTALGYYYSFVYGGVKFIMLNTGDLVDHRLKDEQYNWLINELESNTARWTVVAMHEPMYSVGKYGADETRNANSLGLRDQLQGVFAEYGVDLVLQGHDHAISRTYPIDAGGAVGSETIELIDGVEYIVDPDGVIYLMNGPAGTQQRAPYEVDETLYAYATSSKKASYAEITVTEDTLTVTVKWLDGANERVYYTWGIKK